jgi:hypothetical protein
LAYRQAKCGEEVGGGYHLGSFFAFPDFELHKVMICCIVLNVPTKINILLFKTNCRVHFFINIFCILIKTLKINILQN